LSVLNSGTRPIALHRDFTKLTMKFRPLTPHAFPFTPLVEARILIATKGDSEKKIRNCGGTRRAIIPLIPPEEW